MKKIISMLLVCAFALAGCAVPVTEGAADVFENEVKSEIAYIEEEAVALAESPAPKTAAYEAAASGVLVKKNEKAEIDYSNAHLGYVMVKYKLSGDSKLKVQVKTAEVTYTYNLTAKEWTVLPLSEGDGKYTVTVYKNVTGTKYAAVISLEMDAVLENEFSAFLYPNQYVNYTDAPETVAKAALITKGLDKALDKVAAVYDYVVDTLEYDTEKAKSVKSGYLPVLDTVLEEKKGICFDYAALMAGMLRSQNVPCKLVVGYAGKVYHAWISVWSEDEGWIDGVIWFNGTAWQRMDPTFASSADRSESIMKYIGDGENYSAKYLY
ncbi:MAG: transglutaminase domain-containing protein [Ruminococcaceae bacterium]|nr:transglutaminase domain-containing protein [Oscillospiraceae bacterium]